MIAGVRIQGHIKQLGDACKISKFRKWILVPMMIWIVKRTIIHFMNLLIIIEKIIIEVLQFNYNFFELIINFDSHFDQQTKL